MQSREESLRHQIALGWVLKLLVEAITLLFMTITSILQDNDFFTLKGDPGQSIHWMVYLIAVSALMPIYVHSVHGLRPRLFRWVAVAVAALSFVFYLLHHLGHWQAGQRPDLSSHVLDLVMEVVSLWIVVQSVRWARAPRTEAA
jgi:hypothetical protein